MNKNKSKRHVFIFEGIDGSGKDTRIEQLHNILYKNNLLKKNAESSHLINSCGHSAVGRVIKEYLSEISLSSLENFNVLHLFMAEQFRTLTDIHTLFFQRGYKYLIINRSGMSTYAYGMANLKLRNKPERKLYSESILKSSFEHFQYELNNLSKDIQIHTFFLDVSVKTAIERLINNREKIENTESVANLKRVRKEYLKLIDTLDNVVTVNNEIPVETFPIEIKNVLKDIIDIRALETSNL